jgi:hypothetical protein
MERGPVSLRALLGIAALFMGLMVLLSRHSATAQEPADAGFMAATAVEAGAQPSTAQSSPPAQSSPVDARARDALRRTRLARDVALVEPVLEQWSAAASLARETPAKALQSRIATLQDIRARFGLMQLSEQCAVEAQRANGEAMDAHITYFIAVENQWPTIRQRLEQAERASRAAKAAGAACRV